MAEIELVQVTYRQIADCFAIGIEGARIKAKRRAAKGEWRIIPGNHPQDIVRVEMPADEFRMGPLKPQRIPPQDPGEGVPTSITPQEPQRRDTNDLEALVAVVSQLTSQSHAMTERLIEAERLKSEAQRDAAIAQAEVKVIEERLVLVQEQHLTELKALQERMMEKGEQRLAQVAEDAGARERDLQARLRAAENDLAVIRARPWWRRLAG